MSEHIERIRAALVAAYHIAECGEHPEHLLEAENKARAALPALDALAAELAEARSRANAKLRDVTEWFDDKYTALILAAERERDEARAERDALRNQLGWVLRIEDDDYIGRA